MNLFKKLLIWSVIAVFIESIMFFSLDRIYAKSLSGYKEVKSVQKTSKKTYNDVKVPENAENIEVSYDGKYISYYEDKVLKVVNSEDGKSQSIDTSSNVSICYFKWIPDSNLILICEKDNKNRINFYKYNPSKDSKIQITDHDMKPLIIQANSKNDKVENIVTSTDSHVMYTKVLHSNGKSDIYRGNVMNQTEKIKTSNNEIGNISMLNLASDLIYEDKEEDEIKNVVQNVTKNKKGEEKKSTKIYSIEFDDNNKKVLLGTDAEDKIYIGMLEKGKVSKILFGDLKTPIDNWKSLKLPEITDKKDIIITKEGDIYINDQSKGYVKNLVSNTETKYNGTFIGIQNKNIYNLSDNKVSRTALK